MAGLIKALEADGTYSVLAAGRSVRGSMSSEDADEVMVSLASMEPDDE